MSWRELIEAFNTVFRSPEKDLVSIALATDVGGFSVLGGVLQPERPTTKYPIKR
tara:strand:+ start:2153 stop:2314 length:162 start_codon:yes stop_codon:yes gene_type:complete